MYATGIKLFKKLGRFEEALELAYRALEARPEDIWIKRSAAWVFYHYLKKNAQPESFTEFKNKLIEIKELQLPEDEKMVFDSCAWQIGKMVYGLSKADHVDDNKFDELFDIIKDFHFTKPSEAYTFVYKAFHKGHQDWNNYLTFADWWNLDNLRSEDYLKEEFNGRKIMSIAEQAYIAYSKKLLEGEPADPFGQRVIDKEKIQLFLPKLNDVIEKHPEYQYPPYYKAKLLLALGSDDDALSAFLPFARQKRNDFWVWELLAEIFSEDRAMQFACYCKALSLRTQEDYLVKLRQKYSELLIERQMYDEAKTEIQKIVETRERQGWKIPESILEWTEQAWYKSATAKNDNMDLYARHISKADEVLFQDVQEELIVVEFVNENKRILNFVKDKEKHGSFKYMEGLTKPRIGDVLKVRFYGGGKNGFYKVFTAKSADADESSDAIKKFEGTLKVISPENFGFVDDIFISPGIVEKFNAHDGQTVRGRAILSFNKKKNEWGWKAIELEQS